MGLLGLVSHKNNCREINYDNCKDLSNLTKPTYTKEIMIVI